jgi:hypothetical protein
MKERTVKTLVSNAAVVLVLGTVAVYRPSEPLLFAGLTALLIVNGYEAAQRLGNGGGGKI